MGFDAKGNVHTNVSFSGRIFVGGVDVPVMNVNTQLMAQNKQLMNLNAQLTEQNTQLLKMAASMSRIKRGLSGDTTSITGLVGQYKFESGVVAPDGKIYCIPRDAAYSWHQ